MRRFIWSFLAVALVATVACGGSTESVPADAPGGETEATAAAEPEAMTPADLGDAIGALYPEALAAVVDLMADFPPAADLQPKVADLKEEYIAKFVALGEKKEELDDAGKAAVNSKVRMAINGVDSAVFSSFSEGIQHYQKAGEQELANLLTDFNVITQYADFELLKKQAPEEAERLGIE